MLLQPLCATTTTVRQQLQLQDRLAQAKGGQREQVEALKAWL